MSKVVAVKRVYDEPGHDDGLRVLVDRLWPRGLSKEKAAVDRWMKELGPSHELRKWFAHDPARWPEFCRRYHLELDELREPLMELRTLAGKQRVTLLFGARDREHNQAIALSEYLSST